MINPTALAITGILSYWLAAILLALFYRDQLRDQHRNQKNHIFFLYKLLWTIGLLVHAVVLSLSVFTPDGINLGLSNAISTAGWMVALVLYITCLAQPVRGLGLLVLPLAALSLFAGLFIPDLTTHKIHVSLALDLHIFLSLLAYSVLALAAAQALLLSYQHNRLRKHKPTGVVSYLAPMQHTEALMFILITLGFTLLTLSLGSGFLFLDNFLTQGQVRKTILSIIAWVIFAILLWGRWKLGWRGARAIRLTLWGFGLLALAYFGSKLIKEVIFHRA